MIMGQAICQDLSANGKYQKNNHSTAKRAN
jgi:hypothetical protein